MQYRTLGKTGLRVSEIGFGTWGLGGASYGSVDDAESARALLRALELGVNFYDTADLYGDGHAEEVLGSVFAARRGELIIATKGGTLPHTTFVMPQDFSRDHMSRALDGSLGRLGTDYIDVYFLHSPPLDDLRGNDDLFATLEEFKADGRVRHLGISARTPGDALEALAIFPFQVAEVNFNVIDHRAVESGFFDRAAETGLGVVARTPLAFGYLSGRLTGGEDLEDTDHRKNWPKAQLARWAAAPNRFDFLFADGRRTPAQAALRFCLEHPAVGTVIPGMMTVAEVEEDTAASDGVPALSPRELAKVAEIYRLHEHEFYDKSFQKVKEDD